MYLKIVDVTTPKRKMKISLEKVTTDLLMISLTSEYDTVPNYWRLTANKSIPPLEIGVDRHSGYILNATFYVDGMVTNLCDFSNVFTEKGDVIVDTGVFEKENEYIDINSGYTISAYTNRLTCCFVDSIQVAKKYENNRVEILVDSNNRLVGFSILNLTESEFSLIHNIGTGLR